MGEANRKAGRGGAVRAVLCAASLCLFGGLLATTGCAEPKPHDEPIVHVVKGAKDFPCRLEVGRVSLGYPETLWVIDELEPQETNALGNQVTATTALVGDNDFSHGFFVGEVVGMGFDEMREFAETAQEQAPARAAALEEKARESEVSAQMFGGMAEHFRHVVYRDPQFVVVDGHRGMRFDVTSDREGAGVSRMCLVEIDDNAIGFVMCGFSWPEYDADPAFWDDIFASLEVR